MDKPQRSWEAAILLFAIAVTATTGLAYRFMLMYNLVIPWFVWVLLVVVSAAATLVPQFIRRQR